MVYSDQKSLKHLLQQPVVSADHQNWLSKLLGFKFDVVYKPELETRQQIRSRDCLMKTMNVQQ